MPLTLHNLRVLCSVFELGSLGRAADHLHLSESAVSLQLRVLNEHFGTRLFQRDGRHLVPTEAGRLAHQHAMAILQQVADAESALRDIEQARRGRIAVAGSLTVGSYLLPDLLLGFAEAHPQAQLTVQVYPAAEMFERIVRGEVEFGLTLHDPAPEPLASERLGEVEAVIVAQPTHPWTVSAPDRDALGRARWVCAPVGTRGRETFDRLLAENGISRCVALEFGHPEGVKRAIERGAGIAVTYRFVAQRELEAGSLGEVRTGGLRLSTGLYVVYRPRRRLGPLGREVLAYVRAVVPPALQAGGAPGKTASLAGGRLRTRRRRARFEDTCDPIQQAVKPPVGI